MNGIGGGPGMPGTPSAPAMGVAPLPSSPPGGFEPGPGSIPHDWAEYWHPLHALGGYPVGYSGRLGGIAPVWAGDVPGDLGTVGAWLQSIREAAEFHGSIVPRLAIPAATLRYRQPVRIRPDRPTLAGFYRSRRARPRARLAEYQRRIPIWRSV